MKYTPAPWTIGFATATNPVAVIHKEGRGDIAFVYRSGSSRAHTGIGTDEAKANAALLATAPELLEILEALADSITNFEGGMYTVEQRLKLAKAAQTLVRKAWGR
jgi:hypothetical protein